MYRTLLLSSVLLSASLAAQPVLTATELEPPVGTLVTQFVANYIPAGPATSGFTYDVSSITLGNSSTSQLIAPSSTPYAASFPAANVSSAAITDPNLYTYQQYSTSEVLHFGFHGTTTSAIYSNPEKIFSVPMAYTNTFTDAFAATGANQGQSYTRAGSVTGSYNGHGTIILPYGTVPNVARFELVENYSDQSATMTISYQSTSVSYYKAGTASAIFATVQLLIDFGAGLNPYTSYSIMLDPAGVGFTEYDPLTLGARMYPNPASGTTTLEFVEGIRTATTANLIDATGRLVRQIPLGGAIGQTRVLVDLNGLEAGHYFVQLLDTNGASRTLPLMVE